MYKTLTIKNGSTTILSATTNPNADYDAVVLSEENGWDRISNVAVETQPKLTGPGSYVVAERVGEREMDFVFNYLTGARAIHKTLENLLITFANLTFEMRYYNDGSNTVLSTEVLAGKLTALDIPNGYRDWNDISINVICPNPIKQ